ncbi:hypothetical protein ACFV9C_13680 [Kribbella sp. NPDC059898]|uniref:hypothetical protein n=1 Tax=Kribbella sp. NPDC059898 TaxID=3346995 RepID=UPI00364BE6C8
MLETPWPLLNPPHVDRADQREALVRQLTISLQRGTAFRFYVHALDGYGRRSLAAEFFHEYKEAFGEAWVEVEARRADGTLVAPGEMLGQALRGLSVPASELPDSDDERRHQYGLLSARHKFLLVLKNVVTVEQVEPLLPSSPTAGVIVTVDHDMRELRRLNFEAIELGKLPKPFGAQLMRELLLTEHDEIDSATMGQLLELCDGHPLLLRVLAAQLRGQPEVARKIVSDVRASRISVVGLDDSGHIAATLDRVYQFGLTRAQQQAYRLLALIPGPDFGISAAAAALGLSEDATDRQLRELADRKVLHHDRERDRFEFHTILREDAKERALATEGSAGCASVVRTVLEWALEAVGPREEALVERWRVWPLTPTGALESRSVAFSWFDAEWRSVCAGVIAATRYGFNDLAWKLCVGVFSYLRIRGHIDDCIKTHNAGLEAAELAGDLGAVMQLRSQRGAGWLAKGDLDAAEADFRNSLEFANRISHLPGLQSGYEWLGKTELARARVAWRVAAGSLTAGDDHLAAAMRYFGLSRQVVSGAGAALPVGQTDRMLALLAMQESRAAVAKAFACQRAGLPATAVSEAAHIAGTHAVVALDYFGPDHPELDNRAKCLQLLGQAELLSADPSVSVARFDEAVALFAADRTPRAEAAARADLGDALTALGEDERARAEFTAAQGLFAELGDERAAAMKARLARD